MQIEKKAFNLRQTTLAKKRFVSSRWLPYLLIAPSLLLIGGLLFYPVLNVFYYSLQNYNPSKPYGNGFAGLDNFVRIFTQDPLFYASLGISLQWVASEVVLQLVFGLLMALVLNQKFRMRGLFRAIALLPWAISGVITATIWSLIYNEHMGVANDLLLNSGLIKTRVAWTASPETVLGAVILAELWRGIPFFAITLLAALQTIPTDLYEACVVDGGGRWKAFRYITLPFLKNTIILATLLRAVWEFNNVDIILSLTGGGPSNMTTTLSMYVANLAINEQNFGYASALTVIGFFILLIFALCYFKISGYGKED
jgi:multiple sugar transport system permease protein